MLLGMPDRDSLPTLRELCLDHGWLGPAIDELAGIPLEQWQAEHTRLFINGYPKTPCTPFESVYRHGRMEGPACDELQRLYSRAGVSPNGDLPADYLGTMLAFAALLLRRNTPQATQLLQELEHKHLACWLPEFSGRLLEEARLRLYRDIGERLHGWIGVRS